MDAARNAAPIGGFALPSRILQWLVRAAPTLSTVARTVPDFDRIPVHYDAQSIAFTPGFTSWTSVDTESPTVAELTA